MTISVPMTKVELRVRIAKLKDKEARLEADLAIREFPDVEEAIMTITLAMVEVRKVEDSLRMVRKAKIQVSRVEMLKKKIAFFRSQIATFEEMLEEELGAEGAREMTKMVSKKALAIRQLRYEISKFSDLLDKHKVELTSLLPSLADYLSSES